MKIKTIIGVLTALLVTIGCSNGTAEQVQYISAKQAQEMTKKDTSVVVLDVRSGDEYASGHIKNAKNIPVNVLDGRIAELSQYKNRTIIAVCRTDRRSTMAAEILMKNGFRVNVIQGGMNSWADNGLPIITK